MTGFPDVTAEDSGNCNVVLVALVTVAVVPLLRVVVPPLELVGPLTTDAAEETGARKGPVGVCTICIIPPVNKNTTRETK